MKDLFAGCLGVVAVLAVITLLVFWTVGLNAVVLPFNLQIQRNAAEQSKSFVDAHNSQMLGYVQDANRNDISEGQFNADKNAICALMGRMPAGSVNRTVQQFINNNGGCK